MYKLLFILIAMVFTTIAVAADKNIDYLFAPSKNVTATMTDNQGNILAQGSASKTIELTIGAPYLITATHDGKTNKCVIIAGKQSFTLAHATADNCQFLSASAGRSLVISQQIVTQ